MLDTDASLKGCGAIISQNIDRKVIAVPCASKNIKTVMGKYSSFKLEF